MFKKIVFILGFFVITTESIAQVQAVTSTGDEVILYNDGTWKYVKKSGAADKIETNKGTFGKSKEAGFLLKSNIAPVGIHLDPQKWSFKKSEKDDEPEYSLQLKGKDAYGMMLVERIEIPLESLRNIALENAKEASPDVQIVHEEYRIVNGTKVLCMQIDGSIQGVKFSYFGYYFSFGKGSVQFVTYTSQGLLKDYKQEMEDLLNGFVVL